MQDRGYKIERQESSENLPKRGEKMDKTAQPTGVAIIGSKIGNLSILPFLPIFATFETCQPNSHGK
jgi:hypothetical protein